ncbi:MAG TPA: sugar phosphate isomerase/epimerase [Acidobacteriota bacterium]|nr:sugar phosphate isomerase/epimerase [Acidobacteriota bacterium]
MKQNRRKFIVQSAGVAAGLGALSVHNMFAGTKSARPAWPGPIGLALYTVRNEFASQPSETLKRVAAIGYKEVEGGMGKLSAEELSNYLQDAGLRMTSGHFDYPSDPDKYSKAVEFAHKLGLQYMCCSFSDSKTVDGWKKIADDFNRAGRQVAGAGMQFAYHNHLQEFRPVGDTNGYEILIANTDPKLVRLQIDVFWITWAKQDPVAYMKRLAGRVTMFHIKDRKKDWKWDPLKFPGEKEVPFTEVGSGAVDWKSIFANANGVERIFVEQDSWDRKPMESARMSYEYLRGLAL